jgi:tetratricopeptide (TPR) repeat protein
MKSHLSYFFASIMSLSSAVSSASDHRTEAQVLRAEVDRILGPLVLTSELSPESLQVLVDEAESQYKRGLTAQAMDGYLTIISLSPRASKAWLRVGNLHHQAGLDLEAITAYQKAASFAATDQEARATRDKALLNISMLYLEKAGHALAGLEENLLDESASDQLDKTLMDPSDKRAVEMHRQLEIRQQAQELETRAQLQANRIRTSPKRMKVSLESVRP